MGVMEEAKFVSYPQFTYEFIDHCFFAYILLYFP